MNNIEYFCDAVRTIAEAAFCLSFFSAIYLPSAKSFKYANLGVN